MAMELKNLQDELEVYVENARKVGYDEGRAAGYAVGYEEGYDDGYEKGYEEGANDEQDKRNLG